MSKTNFFPRRRPFLSLPPTSAHRLQSACPFTSISAHGASKKKPDVTHDYQKRIAQLDAHKPLSQSYPRVSPDVCRHRISKATLEEVGAHLKPGKTLGEDLGQDRADLLSWTLAGRITSIRAAGSKLIFMDLTTEDGPVQSVVKFGRLQELNHALTVDTFKAFAKIARKGDIYTMRGNIHRTESGELSILARTLPELLSPALHQIPEALQDPEARARNRHIDMLVNPEAIQTIHVRHHIEATMQSFFNSMGFVKVTTPLISAGAGGALARPFETEATELPQEKLNLRIAPELWLKRLVVGGMDKIYEIGPAFRNEGVDATHNPEFNTCEFYQAYATLSELMDITKNLLNRLNETMRDLRGQGQLEALRVSDILLDSKIFSRDLPQHEFIPTLEEKLQRTLPDLQSDGAFQELRDIFSARSLPEPSSPTLPRLLDALAAEYLEPLSRDQPCFLTHHPACMSPLSKHFRCPRTGQTVAARAELFIDGREYANMYEEENSPFEQRRKLEDQLRQRDVDQEAMQVDESYLQALEWALPPTGGWGCGIDRLVMLFSGRERMGDVLAFGSLRNVVGLAKG